MIKQTKQQFENFEVNNVEFDTNGVLIATLDLHTGNNYSGYDPQGKLKDILVFRENQFVYQTAGVAPKNLSNNGGITKDNNGNITLTNVIGQTQITGRAVAIYKLGTAKNFDGIFTSDVPLISIDYINDQVENISFYQTIPSLEEINLADGRTTISGYIRNLHVSDNNQLYIGNSNRIPYNKGSFKGKKLVLPYSADLMYTIPDGCFAGNTELLEVVIPRSCYGIGAGAFKGCTNLQHVYISNAVTSIGDGAFDGCTYPSLEFEVESGNTKFVGLTGCLLERNTDNTYSILHATSCFFDVNNTNFFASSNVCLPSNSSILPTTFSNTYPWAGMYSKTGGSTKLVDYNGNVITTTGKVVTVKDTTITMGANYAIPIYFLIKEIKPNACAGDINITNVTLATWGSNSGFQPGLWFLQTIGAGAFKGCTTLTTIKLPNTAANSDFVHYTPWTQTNQNQLTIGESAFEGCTSLGSLELTAHGWLGKKAFFGCTGLTSVVNNSNMFISLKSLNNVGKNTGDPSPNVNRLGELCFGNTPNLASITGNNTFSNAIFSEDQIAYNPQGTGNNGMLLVGCKNTNFHYYTSIGESAFYGCSGLTGTLATDSVVNIGQTAFYGCTGISSVNFQSSVVTVYSKAFYGCMGLTSLTLGNNSNQIILYSQAFAKCGINDIVIPHNKIVIQDTDVFDDCPIKNVSVYENTTVPGAPHPIASSSTNNENALMTRYTTTGYPMTVIKGGYASRTLYNWGGGNITEIKSNAYLNNDKLTTGGNVTIPSTVTKLGSTVFKGSKINGSSVTTVELRLGEKYITTFNYVVNNNSMALLYMIGAKYFENILNYTYDYYSNNYHYYWIDEDNANYRISLIETAGGTSIPIWRIGYDSDEDIELRCICTINPDCFVTDDTHHVEKLDSPFTVKLLYRKQLISPAKAQHLFANDIIPGEKWMPGTDVELAIPDDLYTAEVTQYAPFSTVGDGAFSDTNWMAQLNSGRLLSNMKAGFKGCTHLGHIYPVDTNNEWSNYVNNSIFDGSLPESIFEGCSQLSTPSDYDSDYIVTYGKSSLKNSNFDNLDNCLAKGLNFGDECFANTPMREIVIPGINKLSRTAFNGSYLQFAITFGYSGNYFTGSDNATICTDEGVIVIGTANTVLNDYIGVHEKAFKDAPFTYVAQISNKNHYGFLEKAFSGSHITSYTEFNCQNTIFEDSVFENCAYLTSVTIGSGATLGVGQFKGCTALSSVNIPNTVNISKDCFSGCTAITDFTTKADIASGAFSGCTSLSNLILDYVSGATPTIAADAFKDCPLTDVSHNNAPVTAGNYVITRYTVYKLGENVTVFLGSRNYDINSGVFTTNITEIGDYAYCGRGITGSISIPDSVTRIGDYAFANNPGITLVNIPSTVKYIGDHAFDGCTSLDSFTLPDSCTYLGEAALSGCALTKGFNCNALDSQYSTYRQPTSVSTNVTGTFNNTLDLTNSMVFSVISASAFLNTGIVVVRLPRVCTTVGDSAFKGCTTLTEFEINSNGVVLDASCLYGCNRLKDIWISSNVTTGPVMTNANSLYGVGSSAVGTKKILHAPSTLNNNTFKSSLFYITLTATINQGGNGFVVDWYTV